MQKSIRAADVSATCTAGAAATRHNESMNCTRNVSLLSALAGRVHRWNNLVGREWETGAKPGEGNPQGALHMSIDTFQGVY